MKPARKPRTLPVGYVSPLKGKQKATLDQRYWEKVDRRGPDECWPWLGAKDQIGYGVIWGGLGRGGFPKAHRIALELAGIDVPDGMVADHLCKDRGCQNPAHMRVTTQRINSTENSDSPMAANSRKTHCPHGHPYSDDNIALVKRGGGVTSTGNKYGKSTARMCLTCYPQYWRLAKIPRERPPPGYTAGTKAE